MSVSVRRLLVINSVVNAPGTGGGAPGNNANGVFWEGGLCSFEAVASAWNGATLTLEYLNQESGTALVIGGSTTVTANAFVQGLYLPAGWYVPAISGGAPTALNAALSRIPT
jgi:hypothetical protein